MCKKIVRKIQLALVFLPLLFATGCAETEIEKMNREFDEFVAEYEQKVIPLQEKYNNAAYEAAASGDEAEYQRATEFRIMLGKIHSNKENFAKLKRIKDSKLITDSLLSRELDIIYNLYLPNQIDETTLVDIITLDNEVKRKFNTFRPKIGDDDISVNEIEEVLRNSTDYDKLKTYWLASKEVGNVVNNDLINLVKKRNAAAEALGFSTYHEMMLITNGQDPEEVENIFDELDILTRGPYMQLKEEIDGYLASKYSIAIEDLKPWHYQNRFFQTAPLIYNIDYDQFYKNVDMVDIVKKYFSGIGLDISDIMDESDLYEKPGKRQLAFTSDIDRKGKVRILINIEKTQSSMTTLLYEAGFAAYLKYIDNGLPFAMHQPPQFTANDAIASLFSGFSTNSGWLKKVVGIPEEDAIKIKEAGLKQLRLEKFVFARWSQVMYRFEQELYNDPDQDLNALWWDLVENYQLVNKPVDRAEPDWATKTHFITMPCSYHNYALGELFASQIQTYINQNIIDDDGGCDTKCVDNPDIGKYMISKLFKPGAKYELNNWIKNATGEKLSPDYFTNQYIKIR